MSFLGSLLSDELGDGACLTGISIQKDAGEVAPLTGSVLVSLVLDFSDDIEADVAESATAPFLTDKVAGAHGRTSAGRGWFAPFQVAPTSYATGVSDTAWQTVRRALDLTGVDAQRIVNHHFVKLVDAETRKGATSAGINLRHVFARRRTKPVHDWSLADLTVALLLELCNLELADVVDSATNDELSGRARAEYRRERMSAALQSWAVTFDGAP